MVAVLKISERVRRCLAIKKSRYYIAFLAAAVTTIAVTVPASPALAARTARGSATTAVRTSAVTMPNAPAAPESGTICLTNADAYCLGISAADAVVIVEGIRALVRIIEIYKGKDNDGDDEEEVEEESNDEPTDLCLQDTGLRVGVDATWGPCGANGTVWIFVPHNDG